MISTKRLQDLDTVHRERPPARLVRSVLLLAALACAAPVNAVQWYTSWEAAQPAITQRERPVLVYFYTLKARPCHQMQTVTFVDPEVTARMEEFICISLHQPDYKVLFRDRFQLFKVPSVIFLNQAGQEIDRAIGYKDAEEFAAYLDRLLDDDQALGAGAMIQGGDITGTAIDLRVPREGTEFVLFRHRNPTAREVFLVGDFNDWRTDATPMERGLDGVWHAAIYLTEGAYEYLYFEDGEYVPDGQNPLTKPNPYGGSNSIVIVGNPPKSPLVEGNSVTFILFDASATEVQVAGTFNGWARFTMFRNPDEEHMWGVRYANLPPGVYEYKYIIDGEWMLDAENYEAAYDRQGNANNTFTIQ